jgi:dTDP-4-dehydrorhamnose reductase
MLGQACLHRLAAVPGWTVAGTQRVDPASPDYLDVSASSEGLERALSSGKWDYIVNATGVLRSLINLQDLESVRRAIRVNATVPYEVATIAGRFGARVIHVSTDAVFGGSSDEPCTEASPTSPDDFYGRTKLLGECHATNVLNLRCSIVGRNQHRQQGLIEWLLALRPGSTVNGYGDYTWSAATTVQVADLCAALMAPGVFDRLRSQSPVYHFAPNQPISKHEFLCTLAEVAGRDVTVNAAPNPGGAVRRTLATRFADFQRLLPEVRPWKEVLSDAIRLQIPPSDPIRHLEDPLRQ